MDLVNASSLPECGRWFDPPSATEPCCDEHGRVGLRGTDQADTIQAGLAAPPSDVALGELTTALLRTSWGPAWPGWLCIRDVFGGRLGCDPLPCEPPRHGWYQTSSQWPIVAIVSATLAGADVAAHVEIMGTKLRYVTGGLAGYWPTGVLDVQYRAGAVPPGAELPWRRLYCQLRRRWRPVEGLQCSIPRDRAVRSISTPGGTTAYTDREVEQGLLGWDPVVSAFVEAGIAQRGDTYLAGAGGVWAPSSRRPTFTSLLNVVTT